MCFEQKANVAEKLTQRQAVSHQVRGPDVVDGFGSRIEDEGSTARPGVGEKVEK